MPSSTSSSDVAPRSGKVVADTRASYRSIWLIVAGVCLIGVASEAISLFGLHRISKIERRIQNEYQDSRTLPTYSATNTPTVLLLGNSLLLFAVDMGDLHASVAGKYDIHRLAIEQTGYVDLYFLLRKLFRSGSRPHDVVLCLSVSQLIGDDSRGEYMARYMDAIDVAAFSRRRGMDATSTSSYFFAHWSDWYANRTEIRKVLLGRLMPDARELAVVLGNRAAHETSAAEIERKSEPRLRELKELCNQYGSHLTILVPASLGEDHTAALQRVGNQVGVRVLVPERPGEMSPSMFSDGFHLTASGARVFTGKLGPEL